MPQALITHGGYWPPGRDCARSAPDVTLAFPALSVLPSGKTGGLRCLIFRSSTAMCICSTRSRFGYAWTKSAPSLNRTVLPERPHQGRRRRSKIEQLRLRRGRCRPAAASRRGGVGDGARDVGPAPEGHGRGAAARARHGDRAGARAAPQAQDPARHPPADPEPARPGLLHPARLHRRAEAARRRTTSPSTSASSTITCRTSIKMVQQCPEVRFVLDHIGKPAIKAGIIDPWRQHMKELASLPERLLQDLRRHHRGRPQELDARAAEALHRPRHRELRLRPRRCMAATGTCRSSPAPIPQWVEIVDWVVEGATRGGEAKALPRQRHPLLSPRPLTACRSRA